MKKAVLPAVELMSKTDGYPEKKKTFLNPRTPNMVVLYSYLLSDYNEYTCFNFDEP